uniref:DAGKc domain-containing protein n=1 Tax=Zea mays TaxID=4577 RepID=A0A804QXV4_MAIZE
MEILGDQILFLVINLVSINGLILLKHEASLKRDDKTIILHLHLGHPPARVEDELLPCLCQLCAPSFAACLPRPQGGCVGVASDKAKAPSTGASPSSPCRASTGAPSASEGEMIGEESRLWVRAIVVNGLLQREDWETAIKVPLGIISAGTGNGMARSLLHAAGEPFSISNAVFAIIRGHKRALDVTSVVQGKARFFSVLMLTWGLVADVDIESEKYRWMGSARLDFYVYSLH